MQTANPVTTPAAIKTAEALLKGRFPLAASLGISIPYDKKSDLYSREGLDLLFDPERIVGLLQAFRSSLVKDITFDEEEAVNAGDPSACLLLYDRVCAEALKTLVGFVDNASTHPTPRLLARLCAACHEELAALVAEWNALAKGGGA